MAALQGMVAFRQPAADDRARALTSGPGWGPPIAWHDDLAVLSLCANARAARREAIDPPARDRAGRVVALVGVLFEPKDLARREGFDPGLSPTSLAALFLERYGIDGLARLDGDYALARWDLARRELLLAIAPMATRALYWHADDAGLRFASTLAQLFRFPSVPREPSPLDIAAHLSSLVLDPAATLFRDVRQVGQGQAVIADPSGVRAVVLWRPDPTKRLRLRRDEDYVDAARDLLDRAVAVRLNGHWASTISGGLDSSAVAATAARLVAPSLVSTYTAVPPPESTAVAAAGFYADERGPVGAIAAMHPNLRPQFHCSASPAPVERDQTALFLATGRPLMMAGVFGWMDPVHTAARGDGHDTLLYGGAGNFTLSFDGTFGAGDMVRDGRPMEALRLLAAVTRSRGHSVPRALLGLTGDLLPGLRRAWRGLRGRPADWVVTSPVRRSFAAEIGLAERAVHWGEAGVTPIERGAHAAQAHFMERRRARHVEAYVATATLYGLDVPDPLSDRALAEFCLAIPREQYMLDGRQRSLARRVLADRLPASILNQPLYGQVNVEWFDRLEPQRAEIAAELDRLARVPLAAEMLDLPRLKALVDDWPRDGQAALARKFEYESLLTRAVRMGRFLRWLDGGNA